MTPHLPADLATPIPEEHLLLAEVLRDRMVLANLGLAVRASDFAEPWHASLFEAIEASTVAAGPADTTALTETLLPSWPDAAERIEGLVAEPAVPEDVPDHVAKVRERARRRAAFETLSKGLQRLETSGDLNKILTDVHTHLTDVERTISPAEETTALLDEATRELKTRRAIRRSGKLVGIPTGFAGLDAVAGGWTEGLVFIGAWSSGGKTSFLLTTLIAAANAGFRWRLYSVDMPVLEVLLRIVTQHSKLDGRKIAQADLDDREWRIFQKACAWIVRHGCSITTSPATIDEVVADALKHRHAFDLMAIDTLQSLEFDGDSRAYEFNCRVASQLKMLKKALRKPVLVSCQLNDPPVGRDANRDTLRPTLNQLEGARRFTHEASKILLLWRGNYQGGEVERTEDGLIPAELILAKSQMGSPAILHAFWDDRSARFVEKG